MMEYTEFKKEMKEKALKIDVNLSDLQVEKFYKYLSKQRKTTAFKPSFFVTYLGSGILKIPKRKKDA